MNVLAENKKQLIEFVKQNPNKYSVKELCDMFGIKKNKNIYELLNRHNCVVRKEKSLHKYDKLFEFIKANPYKYSLRELYDMFNITISEKAFRSLLSVYKMPYKKCYAMKPVKIQKKVHFSVGESFIKNYYKLCIAVLDMARKDSQGVQVVVGTSSVVQAEATEFLNNSKLFNLYKDYIFLYRKTNCKDTYNYIDEV